MTPFTRRTFVTAGSAFVSSIALGQPSVAQSTTAGAKLTAGGVIERIKKNVGVPWFEKTVDNLLTGTPDTAVRGIATTMMATLDVVQRSIAHGRNLIITHETPFYLYQDQMDARPGSGSLSNTARTAFCRETRRR